MFLLHTNDSKSGGMCCQMHCCDNTQEKNTKRMELLLKDASNPHLRVKKTPNSTHAGSGTTFTAWKTTMNLNIGLPSVSSSPYFKYNKWRSGCGRLVLLVLVVRHSDEWPQAGGLLINCSSVQSNSALYEH